MCVDANEKNTHFILRQAGSHARPCSAPRGPHWPLDVGIQSPVHGVPEHSGRVAAPDNQFHV